jgi:hypothetical protein
MGGSDEWFHACFPFDPLRVKGFINFVELTGCALKENTRDLSRRNREGLDGEDARTWKASATSSGKRQFTELITQGSS